MSNIILFQQGIFCIDPKTNKTFNPWYSHILDTVRQIRIWNPHVPIKFIVDDVDVFVKDALVNQNVEVFYIRDLHLSQDVSVFSNYYHTDKNPLWRTSMMRFFYIEELMRQYNLKNVFTFDNDVLLYENVDLWEVACQKLYSKIAMTRVADNALICGMMWIPNSDCIRDLNNELIREHVKGSNRLLNECELLHQVYLNSLVPCIDILPIWFTGPHSQQCGEFGGFFDPATIGQYMGGCHNGSPKYHIMMHHTLGPYLKEYTNNSDIMITKDVQGRKFYTLYDQTRTYKLLSMHVHTKNMKEFMSHA